MSSPESPLSRISGILNLLLKLIVSGGLLAYLVIQTDLSTFTATVRGADIRLFAVATGFFVLSNALGAGQWYLLLRAQNLAVSVGQAVVFYWVGVFFNNVLLGNIGGDALRIYDIRRLTGSSGGGAASTAAPPGDPQIAISEPFHSVKPCCCSSSTSTITSRIQIN